MDTIRRKPFKPRITWRIADDGSRVYSCRGAGLLATGASIDGAYRCWHAFHSRKAAAMIWSTRS